MPHLEPHQLIFFGIVGVLLSLHFFFSKKRVQKRLVAYRSQNQNVEFPIVIPLKMGLYQKANTVGRRLLYFSFALGGALLGYASVFMAEIQFSASSAAVMGALLGVLIVTQIKEVQPVNEPVAGSTQGRELVFDQDILRISRALVMEGNELPYDEPDYYVLPLRDCQVTLYKASQRMVFQLNPYTYSIQQSGRRFWIGSSFLDSNEGTFVAALDKSGVKIQKSGY